MSPILIAGTITVQFALIAYSIAILTEQWQRRITSFVLLFLSAGVFFDIAATVCMIIGSSRPWYSLHGILGYSSLAGMATDAALIWRLRLLHGSSAPVPRPLHLYSRFAYGWWVLAYITGALLVALR